MTSIDLDPAQAAGVARSRMGIGQDGPIPDILRLVEQVGVAVFIVDLPVQSFAGAYQTQRDVPFIMVNQSHSPVRKRFTLAHEYGHHFLNHGPTVDKEIDWSNRPGPEKDANSFAAAFLMPGEAVEQWIEANGKIASLENLVLFSRFFGCSAISACFRLANLGRISATLKNKFVGQISQREHLPLLRSARLPELQDSIYSEQRVGGHFPFESQREAANLVEQGILPQEKFADVLRLNEADVESKISELTDDSPESE